MPYAWFSFSTASTPAGRRCREDPRGCRDELVADLGSCGATLVELYFDADANVARALVRDLDRDPVCRKALVVKWGARYRKLLTVDEAAPAFDHARRLEGEPGADFRGPEPEAEAEAE
ncbi:MAG: hypothetical protein ICV64_01945 [Thermoleophilia bacterium]|nr:hypothetical protein [Thermoleophilia bacterium]